MNASTSARAVARRELTMAISAEARRQIAEHGADGLSLRAVARELGMASSALYRYFPSRDDLLTALIIEAYTALGDAVRGGRRSDRPGRCHRPLARGVPGRARLGQAATARIRAAVRITGAGLPCAADHHRPGGRIPLALFGPLRDGWRAGSVADRWVHRSFRR